MAAASQFLKIEDRNGNSVEGECVDADHAKEIEITGWDWSATNPTVKKKSEKVQESGGSKPKSGGDSDDKIKPSLFTFSKTTDKSTVRLINAMDNGEVFPTATLVIEEEFEASPLPFQMKIVLYDVIVTEVTWSARAASAGFEFDESWELNYRRVEFDYLWRGRPASWIPAAFDRPPDSTEGASKKAPLSAAEQKAAEEERLKAILKKLGK